VKLMQGTTTLDVNVQAGRIGNQTIKFGAIATFNGTQSFTVNVTQSSGGTANLQSTAGYCRINAELIG